MYVKNAELGFRPPWKMIFWVDNTGVYLRLTVGNRIRSVFGMKLIRSLVSLLLLSGFHIIDEASAQDIGLTAPGDKFVGLELVSTPEINEKAYKGHVTTYDTTRGFLHADAFGEIQNSEVLKLHIIDATRFKDLERSYSRVNIDSNTAWIPDDGCAPDCVGALIGTTNKFDTEAVDMLKYYEENTTQRSVSLNTYFRLNAAYEGLCKAGNSAFCIEQDRIGIVMDQSQVGLARIVARSLGQQDESIATFSTNEIDGAVYATSSAVAQAVYRATGPTLSDDVWDLSPWRVVTVGYEPNITSHLHPISFSLSGDRKFLGDILESPTAAREIRASMRDFFNLITQNIEHCGYFVRNVRSYFGCKIHSSDVGVGSEGYGAWIKFDVMTIVFETPKEFGGVLVFNIVRKFGGKASGPPQSNDKYSPINYGDDNEALMAQVTVRQVGQALARFFEPNINLWSED